MANERADKLATLGELRRRCAELEGELGVQRAVSLPAAGPGVEVAAYQLMAEHASDMLSIHAPNGDYLWASASAERLFGWSPADLVGRNAYELFHPDDVARIARDHANHGQDASGAVEYRLRCRDGTWRWAETRSQAHCTAAGVEQIVCITRDQEQAHRYRALIERRRDWLEEELERAAAQLLHAERLATLGTLASGIAHELNNLAQVFVAALDEMATRSNEGLPPEAETMDALQDVRQHLTAYGAQLLRLGRRGSGAEERQDLVQVVADAADLLRVAGRLRPVHYVFEGAASPVWVQARRTELQQIAMNLIGNAVDAVVEAGRDDATRGSVTVRVRSDAAGAVIEVEDTGCGMSAEQVRQAFQPFYTTKPPDRGTGLGLPVVGRIAESFGGHLELESELGRGTVARVTLPLLTTATEVA